MISTNTTNASALLASLRSRPRAAVAGSGFFESWLLTIEGTTGSYNGNGPIVGATIIPGTPDTYSTTVIGGTPPSTSTATVGTTIGLGE